MVTKISEILAMRRPTFKVYDLLRQSMDGPELIEANYTIKKVWSGDEQLVTGQVYAPDTLDSHGDYISAHELRKVAHDFMQNGLSTSIDVMHDNNTVNAVVVESFIARDNDPDYEPGAWVVTTKINDPVIWQAVKRGQLNSYSFEIMTYKDNTEVEVEFTSWYYGFTDPDPHDNHTHPFMVRMDDKGEIVPTKTGIGSDGSPAHSITKSSTTGITSGHLHRIHLRA